jgi:glycosyltransferase involved in cell wall biosynthesis
MRINFLTPHLKISGGVRVILIYADLLAKRGHDVCLGVFGNTVKTQRVIANKVYEAIAMAKSVISADTQGMGELFEDRKNILFCRRADPEDLAEKILELKNNEELRSKIAQSGYELFQRRATPKIIGCDLLNALSKYGK